MGFGQKGRSQIFQVIQAGDCEKCTRYAMTGAIAQCHNKLVAILATKVEITTDQIFGFINKAVRVENLTQQGRRGQVRGLNDGCVTKTRIDVFIGRSQQFTLFDYLIIFIRQNAVVSALGH